MASPAPLNASARAPKSNDKRLHQIDALRGLAALLVLVAHASSSLLTYSTQSGHSDWLLRFTRSVDTGRIGVMVFFIVSGFVIANTLHAPGANLVRFGVRRLFRLYPLFWFSMVLVVVCLQGKNELIPFVTDWKTVAANATMLPTLLGFKSMMIIYWTLETEIVFYLVAATVYCCNSLFHPQRLLMLIVALIGLFAAMMFGLLPLPASLAWQSLPLNLAFMFWGTLFYATFAASKAPPGPIRLHHPLVLATLAVLSPSVYTLFRYMAAAGADDLRWTIAYPSALLIFWALYCANGKWIRASARLGVISYSMYLLHPAAIIMVCLLLDNHPIAPALAHLPLLSLGTMGVAAVMSLLAYVLIEKPFIALARKLTP